MRGEGCEGVWCRRVQGDHRPCLGQEWSGELAPGGERLAVPHVCLGQCIACSPSHDGSLCVRGILPHGFPWGDPFPVQHGSLMMLSGIEKQGLVWIGRWRVPVGREWGNQKWSLEWCCRVGIVRDRCVISWALETNFHLQIGTKELLMYFCLLCLSTA